MSKQTTVDRAELKRRREATQAHARAWGPGFFVKLILIALVDALGLYGLWMAWQTGSTAIAVIMAVLLAVVNWVYFSKRALPAKYLVPGMIFLLIFQIYVMLNTVFVSFTNYGDRHLGTKEDAIAAIVRNSQLLDLSQPTRDITLLSKGGAYYLAYVNDAGEAVVGGQDQPFAKDDAAQVAGGVVTEVPGYEVKREADFEGMGGSLPTKPVENLKVPLADDPEAGSLKVMATDFAKGQVYKPGVTYDEQTDSLIDNSDLAAGVVIYKANNQTGQFEHNGDRYPRGGGWKVTIGFKNYVKLFTDPSISMTFGKVFLWTVVFAFLSVATTFFFGLLLALAFNSERIRGQKIYRVLMILPYAFPGFMAALLFKNLLNRDYGVINNVILGWIPGFEGIDWLNGSTLMAQFTVIMVNLWLGYPYMFLVCTGALQSIPGDILESARVDGAGPVKRFTKITLPLLFVSVAPLLISSFAFNFNNFNLIYFLTGGGPVPPGGSADDPGGTDIMISMVYKLAGVGENPDYGLATALSIVIFLVVGLIAVYSFRKTRSLEDVM
ncbi:MAG: ABC transporter permease subunit [Bifidobacteriaceae bacterium]|jgi:arabinogalactan oligomer/maltooligosaccharide transport system permease protein|nr:ABC transporter permease subunit [Bifidobacteriaceae bacterium]